MAMNAYPHDPSLHSSRTNRLPSAARLPQPAKTRYLVTPVDKGEDGRAGPEFMALPVDREYTAERGQISLELFWASFRNPEADQIYLIEPRLIYLKLPLRPKAGQLAARLCRLACALDLGEFALLAATPAEIGALALLADDEPVCMLCAGKPGYLFYEGYTGGVRCLAGPISLVELNRALKAAPP